MMKTKLFSGILTGVLIASGVSAVPTLDSYNKTDAIINFTSNDSVDLIISDRPLTNSAINAQDPLINIINQSAPVASPEIEESQIFGKADFDILTDLNSNSHKSADNLNAYAFITDSLDKKTLAARWDTNPGTGDAKILHGSTVVVPAPGALLLGSIGAVIIGWLRKSRMLS